MLSEWHLHAVWLVQSRNLVPRVLKRNGVEQSYAMALRLVKSALSTYVFAPYIITNIYAAAAASNTAAAAPSNTASNTATNTASNTAAACCF